MSKEQQPNVKVSVVMCTYNGEHFLRQQMDSILAQDYPLVRNNRARRSVVRRYVVNT